MSIAVRPAPRPTVLTESNPVSTLAYGLLLLYMFVCYSRVLDVTVPSLHIPMLLGSMLYLLTILSGGFVAGWMQPQGKLWIILTVLMGISMVFGVWPGGSFTHLKDIWIKSFPFFFIIVAFASTPSRCAGLLRCMAWAVTVLSILALAKGTTVEGRLMMEVGRFANPNDLAAICLLGLPLWLLQAVLSRGIWMRVVGTGGMAVIFVALMKTGSRGAMIGVFAMALYLFFKSSVAQKVVMVVVSIGAVGIAAATLPPEVLYRYVMVFSDLEAEQTAQAERQLVAAQGSAESRTQLLKNAIALTLKNPLLGVGPGNYAVAENEYAIERGFRKGSWHVSHNMYADISSEVGIPAVICFIWIIVATFRQTTRIQRLQHESQEEFFRRSAFWLRVAMIGFCTAGFFQSVGYSDTLPMLTGIIAALSCSTMHGRTTPSQQPAATRNVPRQFAVPPRLHPQVR